MNKKLPKIYQCSENLITNNKDSYYSFSKEEKGIDKEPVQRNNFISNNFFEYFNKNVEIVTFDDRVINTRILSKRDSHILLGDGTYLEINNIKSIN